MGTSVNGHIQVLHRDRRTGEERDRNLPAVGQVGSGEEMGDVFLTQERKGWRGTGRLTGDGVSQHWAGHFILPAIPWVVEIRMLQCEGKGRGSVPILAVGEGWGVMGRGARRGDSRDWGSPFPALLPHMD